MSLLQMSISATVLTIVIVIIRALAIDRLPKKTFLVLWGVVILRLLVPFSIPSSFSIYSLVNKASIGVPADPLTILGDSSAAMQSATNQLIFSWMLWVWIAGVVACSLFFAISYSRCRRRFATSTPVENSAILERQAAHPTKRKIVVRQSDRIVSPLTYGLFAPIILLPKQTDWQNEKQLHCVLTHEYIHIRRFDVLTKLLLIIAVCVHWFNPLAWVMFILVNRDIELSCDEEVIRSLGETSKSAYALTLISMAEEKSKITPLCNNFSKNAIEERITSIMKIKKTSIAGIILAVALIAGTSTVFATSAAPKNDEIDAKITISKAGDADTAQQEGIIYLDKIVNDDNTETFNFDDIKDGTTTIVLDKDGNEIVVKQYSEVKDGKPVE